MCAHGITVKKYWHFITSMFDFTKDNWDSDRAFSNQFCSEHYDTDIKREQLISQCYNMRNDTCKEVSWFFSNCLPYSMSLTVLHRISIWCGIFKLCVNFSLTPEIRIDIAASLHAGYLTYACYCHITVYGSDMKHARWLINKSRRSGSPSFDHNCQEISTALPLVSTV